MVHVVKSGETLTKIAAKYGITLAVIRKANPDIINPNIIRVGQRLNIPEITPSKDYGKIGKAFEKALKDVEALESVKALKALL